MGYKHVGKVRLTMKEYAVYEITDAKRRFTVRFFNCSDESCKLTPEEIEAEDVIGEGF